MERIIIVCYRRFEATCQSRLQESSSLPGLLGLLKMGLTGCPETTVANYYSTLRNIAEECRSQLASTKLHGVISQNVLIMRVDYLFNRELFFKFGI
jgi:hypothetical protein